MKKINNNKMILIAILDVIIFLLCFILTLVSIIKNDKIIGFAIDSENRIYIGKNSIIEVYNEGVIENVIHSVTSRGYTFTIKDEKIVIFTGTKLYYLDLNGNVIDSEDFTGIEPKELRGGKTFEDSKGNYYELKKSFGRSQIIENDSKIIFQEPLSNYIFNCALFFSWLLFILGSLPILVISIMKRNI